MATYKLIQDVEAEDHVLGPFTFRQFVFALIAVFLFYVCFLLVAKHVAFMLILFLPPAVFFAFFALPLGRDQPTEIWALAKLRYWFKPRKRVWNQDGVKELVTITAPKKIEPVRTKGLSQGEVSSRLRALADTLDTRGWAVKNVDVNTYANLIQPSSDRLIDINTMPPAVPDDDIRDDDDILETASPIARQFNDMIDQSTQEHRQELMDKLNDVRQEQAAQAGGQNNYAFINDEQPVSQQYGPPKAADIAPAEEAAIVSELRGRASGQTKPLNNLRTIQPLGSQPQPPSQGTTPTDLPTTNQAQPPAQPTVKPTEDPAILSLAHNDDLNVSTLAREAKRAKGEDDGEVIVPLR